MTLAKQAAAAYEGDVHRLAPYVSDASTSG